MLTISLCMIVKNEEEKIRRCLDSVKDLVDEIIVVDTGSDDTTKEIVATFTDRIFKFEWVDDFSKARNHAFQQATKDYIFWLDADDVILEADHRKFKRLKETLNPSTDSVTMDYHLAHDEYGNVVLSVKRNRLVKRKKAFQWIGRVHEYLQVGGVIFHSDIAVTHKSNRHDSDRNLLIYERQLAENVAFSPRDLFYFANELKDHHMYERAIYFYEKFLFTGKGWIEDNITTCSKLAGILLLESVEYPDMINLLARSSLIISDSGGLQEEAVHFKVPLVITRKTTEPPETLEAGLGYLAGTDNQLIYNLARKLLARKDNGDNNFMNAPNVFGDGAASIRIAYVIAHYFRFISELPEEYTYKNKWGVTI